MQPDPLKHPTIMERARSAAPLRAADVELTFVDTASE